MKILIIDDDFSMVRTMKDQLSEEKWEVAIALSYEDAKSKISVEEFDVLICDHHLSDASDGKQGLDLIKTLRQHEVATPVLMITERKMSEITPWDALQSGVDDFLKKPYRSEELIARIKALVRRTFRSERNSTNIIEWDGITIDLNKDKVFVDKKEVFISGKPFAILQKFLKKPDTIISQKELLAYLWKTPPPATASFSRNRLRVHIARLRNVLGKKHAKHIRNIHGRGYMWETKEGNKM